MLGAHTIELSRHVGDLVQRVVELMELPLYVESAADKLGFCLESACAQGKHPAIGALLVTFHVLIASLRLWARPKLIPVYVFAAPWLGESADWGELGAWLWELLANHAL